MTKFGVFKKVFFCKSAEIFHLNFLTHFQRQIWGRHDNQLINIHPNDAQHNRLGTRLLVVLLSVASRLIILSFCWLYYDFYYRTIRWLGFYFLLVSTLVILFWWWISKYTCWIKWQKHHSKFVILCFTDSAPIMQVTFCYQFDRKLRMLSESIQRWNIKEIVNLLLLCSMLWRQSPFWGNILQNPLRKI
jgi:hypothetical protein